MSSLYNTALYSADVTAVGAVYAVNNCEEPCDRAALAVSRCIDRVTDDVRGCDSTQTGPRDSLGPVHSNNK